MQHYPAVGTGLLNILAARNRKMLTLYEDLMSRPVLARVAKKLLDLSDYGQQPINRYRHPNQQIAALTTTVPEAVSRSIRNLKTKGVIECTRGQIKIISPQELMDLALIEPVLAESGLPLKVCVPFKWGRTLYKSYLCNKSSMTLR